MMKPPIDWRERYQARSGDDYPLAFARHIFSQRSTLSYLASEVGLEEAIRLAAVAVREALEQTEKEAP